MNPIHSLAFLLVSFFFSGEASEPKSDVLTPRKVAELKGVRQVAISPDSSTIAYILAVPRKPWDDEDGGSWSELYLVDAESGKSRGFITGKNDISAIAWTPDGKEVSFLTKRGSDKNTSLYSIAKDGGEARRVAGLTTDILSYRWKPDGSRVALIATQTDAKSLKESRDKGFKQEIYEEDFQDRKIWIVTPFSDAEKREPLSIQGSVYELEWSPVDDRIAAAISPTPLVDDEYMRKKIHVLDSSTGKIRAQFENEGKLADFEWSPDGKYIAMVAAQDIHDPQSNSLLVSSADGGKLRNLLPKIEGDVEHIAWQNSDYVLYLGAQGTASVFGKVHRDGSESKIILNSPTLAITAMSISNDGRHGAFIASSATHPDEVFAFQHGESEPRRLTNNNPSLSEISFAKQEVIRYPARDGLEIEGILIHPLEEKQGVRYPLIMVVHGGPEAHNKNGWLTNYSSGGQMAAARGFAVFYPNYRGSTGRGVAFSKLSQGDPGGKEFDDLIDGIDSLIDRGLVEKSKVGITGGSYGGYATAWCSTRYSDRFAAGVMFVGISDKISKVGTTDIATEDYNVHSLKHLWENWQFFLERSPIYYADQCKTPLLILHGKDDPRVNPGQSRELYRHIKMRTQTPVRLVFYPGEGHGNRKAYARFDYNLRLLQWMEHYLKGPGGNPPAWELEYQAKKPDEKKTEMEASGTKARQ